MRCYWFRIGAGAVAIFFVGMVILGFTRRGVDRAREFASSIDDASFPTDFVPFGFDGDRLGSLEKVRVERGPGGQLSGLDLTARIEDPEVLARLAGCRIGVEDISDLDNIGGFSCISEADLAAGGYAPFGTIRLEPSGDDRTLFAPAAVVHEVQASIQTALSGVGFHLRANEAGAHMDIQGEGEELFYLRADSNGARILIRDDSGRIVLNLKADSTGAAMDIVEK